LESMKAPSVADVYCLRMGSTMARQCAMCTSVQGLTLVRFSAQLELFLTHIP
jgi:hypothetical protein